MLAPACIVSDIKNSPLTRLSSMQSKTDHSLKNILAGTV